VGGWSLGGLRRTFEEFVNRVEFSANDAVKGLNNGRLFSD
jgi:hypothetical protein